MAFRLMTAREQQIFKNIYIFFKLQESSKQRNLKKFQLETGKFPIRNKIIFQLDRENIPIIKRKYCNGKKENISNLSL